MAIENYFVSIDMCEGKTLCKTVGRSPAARDGDGEHQDEVAIALQERNRKMSIFEVWNFFQEASEVGISLDKLAAVRKRDQSGGIESSAVNTWYLKMLSLYRKRSQLSFYNVNKLCMATDAATHNCQDFLVSTFYSKGQDYEVSAYATAQYVTRTKHLHPFEMNLTEEAETLAAQRQTERLSALKFMMALSAQIHHISKGSLNLTSFELSEELAVQLRPLCPGERRYWDGEKFLLELHDHEEPIAISISEDLVASTPVLKVLMDQGRIGTAAAAFLQAQQLLVNWEYDKVHRLINDAKNGMSWEQQQMKLATTFIFGINYKPYGGTTLALA